MATGGNSDNPISDGCRTSLLPVTTMWTNAQRCISKVPHESTKFVWQIENFSLLEKPVGEGFASTNFTTSGGYIWALSLYPNGANDEFKEYIGMGLELKSHPLSSTAVNVEYDFHLLDLEKNISIYSCGISETVVYTKPHSWGNFEFILRSTLFDLSNGYLIDDKFTVGVEFSIIKEIEHVESPLTIPKVVHDYGEFLENGKLSDVDIVDADGNVIHGHKFILGANSSVFASMFEHKMKENLESKVVIPDLNPLALQEMLKFLYSGKLAHPDNMELVEEVLCAADKYDIGHLKTFCQSVFIQKMSLGNVIKLLILSDTRGFSELKVQAVDFICVNKVDLIPSSEWEELLSKNPKLANEVFIKIINGIDDPDNGSSHPKKRRACW